MGQKKEHWQWKIGDYFICSEDAELRQIKEIFFAVDGSYNLPLFDIFSHELQDREVWTKSHFMQMIPVFLTEEEVTQKLLEM